MAENTEGKKGSAGSSGIRLFAARQALEQDVRGDLVAPCWEITKAWLDTPGCA